MRTRFREEKAAQAAARFLQLRGGTMSYMKLIKLWYLLDREALIRWGRPVTYDWYYSMDHGPVLSFTLDRIRSDPDPEKPSYWNSLISEPDRYDVRLIGDPIAEDLSEAEETLIDEVFAEFGRMSRWQLRDYVHSLPEWQDPKGSRIPIRIRDILRFGGLSEEEVDRIEDEVDGVAAADRLLP